MNLRWNSTLSRFEAEFSDFQGDLAAVKAAGFRTDGAPQWIWYSYKAGSLAKLKGRPGLTISPDARAQFNALWAVEERNAKVKAELAEHKKVLKKKLKIEEQEANAIEIPEKGYIDASDLPLVTLSKDAFVPPPPPETRCIICQDPVYLYENTEIPACLWCSKIVLDSCTEVC